MAQTTVKDFAKTLKISEEALLKRMSSAGLSHSSATDELMEIIDISEDTASEIIMKAREHWFK